VQLKTADALVHAHKENADYFQKQVEVLRAASAFITNAFEDEIDGDEYNESTLVSVHATDVVDFVRILELLQDSDVAKFAQLGSPYAQESEV